MKSTIKKLTTLSMVFILVFSLCGCSLFDSRAKVYSRYAISLLDINYKNISKDYMTLTGVSQKDAEAVYVDNMDYQAHNLMNYYGVKEVDDGTILSEFYSYTLELTVYPLDTLETSYDDVVAYIEDFNRKVDDGNYNNTTEVEYETEFAEGIIDILKKTAEKPGYMDPVVLEIPIQPSDDYYYITDDDFLKIDQNILYIRENPSTETTNNSSETTDSSTEASDTQAE